VLIAWHPYTWYGKVICKVGRHGRIQTCPALFVTEFGAGAWRQVLHVRNARTFQDYPLPLPKTRQ